MATNSKNLFESMTRRRVSCPQIIQQLWDAIKSIRNTRQSPTAERIQKVMMKEFGVAEEEVTRQLNHGVRDGIIEVTKRTVSKGNYAGSEQEWYNLPTLKLKADEYDWYCFDCHRAGDVICCSKNGCQRVYHLACISSSELPPGAFVCHVCRMCEPSKEKFQMKRSKLNRLLGYTLQRLKSKYPLTLKDQRLPPPNKSVLVSDRAAQALTPPVKPASGEDEVWRSFLLIAREMNLWIVEEKIDRHRYRLLEEFHADCLNIVHNMVIYNGVDSMVADISRAMVRDCVQDLQEIRQCVDCYKMSHGDKKKQWFCKPCRRPHELVYAKLPGSPYSPAKVMKVEGDEYDVRFFGAPHVRAMVSKSHIRPISVNIHSLQVKRSSTWNRACEELKKHQELLEKARVATRNFTHFVESSSSSESESVDSDEERTKERELRLTKVKGIMDKQSAAAAKQKGKRRRSSSVARASTAEPKKRGRPRANTPVSSLSKGPGRPGRKRKQIYDSSDSLDSLNIPHPSPKKNTDEIFNELLYSDNSALINKTASEKKPAAAEPAKVEKKAEERKSPRGRGRPPATPKKGNSSSESKTNKSDTMDSSTISSLDDLSATATRRRRKTSNIVGKAKFSSSDDSDSDEPESDLDSTTSAEEKPNPRKALVNKAKKNDTTSTATKSKGDAENSDDSSTTDTDSDIPKKAGKDEDSSSTSSDSDDDFRSKPKLPPRTKRLPKAKVPASKNKMRDDSSDDSESVASVKATAARPKPKDTPSESTDVDTPTAKPVGAGKGTPGRGRGRTGRPPLRASERNVKASEKRRESGEKAAPGKSDAPDKVEVDDSSDSETPLSSKGDKKEGRIGQVRDILKKYMGTGANGGENESSDTLKQEESDSDSEQNDKSAAGKSKASPPEKKQEVGVEERRGKSRRRHPTEELKEKEETVVSSSSQEPSTRSVGVQTMDLKQPRLDRTPDLEKELQITSQNNRMLEMEVDKTKVMLERMRSDHDDDLAEINSRHAREISEIKKKQWCYYCENEAIYHCCWNTAYCSVECQQQHWQTEHKRVCRRKR